MATEEAPVHEPTMLSVFALLMAPMLPCRPEGDDDAAADDRDGAAASA